MAGRNPDHITNDAERMRNRALHTVAGKHRNYRGQERIQAFTFDTEAMRLDREARLAVRGMLR